MTIPQRLADPDFQKTYKQLVRGLLTSFGADPSTVGNDTERIVQMEQHLLELGLPETWGLGWHGETNDDFQFQLTIRELADLVPSVPWKDYLEAAFSHKPGFKVTPSDSVWVPDLQLMKGLGEMLENLTQRDKANLLIWRMFIRFVNDFMKTGSEEDSIQMDPFAERCNLPSSSSRKENCICQVNTLFPEAHNDLLMAKYIGKRKKQGIKDMFREMATEFEQIIDDQDWMSKRTKITAKKKVANMVINVGEQSPNTPEFQELKRRISRDDYINNILAIGNYHFNTFAKLVGEEVQELGGRDRERGGDLAERVANAFYAPTRNEMVILTGIITGFLGKGLSFELPKGIIYGGHGGLLGHEMVHGFDSSGKDYDKDGYQFKWWTKAEDKEYANRTQSLVGASSMTLKGN